MSRQVRRGQVVWVATWWDGGRRRRQYHDTRAAAEETVRQRLTEDGEILDEIRRRGLTLREVWTRFNEGTGPAPIDAPQGPTVSKVVEELLKAKATAGRAARYVTSLTWTLEAYAQTAGRISKVTTADVERYLDGAGAASRSTLRARLSTLFGFAVRRGYIARNPVSQVETVRVVKAPPAVMTPEQAGKALEWVRAEAPRALGAFALTLLCGLRPEEAQGSTWAAVRLDAPDGAHVVVEAQTSKVRQRRVVYILPAGAAWLAEAKRIGAELPIGRQPWRRTIRKLAGVLGWDTWPKDVTRHSAASYWLAIHPNVFEVAELLGHSPNVLKTHYRALVTKADAERFWAIRPGTNKLESVT